MYCGVVMLVLGSTVSSVNVGFPSVYIGLLYLIIAVIYIYPLIKGFQFANRTKAACLTNDEQELARGFEGLSALLRFCGILTIIILILYVVVLIGGFIVGFTSAIHTA